MLSIPSEVFATFKCDYCSNLPTRAPIYQQRRQTANEDNSSGESDMIVCADCSVFIAQRHNELVRLRKLECLIPYLRSDPSPLNPLNIPSTSPFEQFEPPVCSSPIGGRRDLKVDLSCSIKGNRTTKNATVLQYTMSITPVNGKQLCLVDDFEQSPLLRRPPQSFQPVEVTIDGAIALTKNPQQIYSHVELLHKGTPSYTQIPGLSVKLSSFSRFSSSNLLSVPPMQEQVTTCSNGCVWRGSLPDLGEHLKTCTMVPIYCCIGSCDWKGYEQLMKGHLYNEHKPFIRNTIEGQFGWQDKFMVVIKYGIIFVFKYFYYEDLEYVEMLVQGVVNHTDMNYNYSVEVYSEDKGQKVKFKTKKTKCMIFNKCVLQKGIVFQEKEFEKDSRHYSFKVEIEKIL